MFPTLLQSVLLASGFVSTTNALNHQLIVGTFGTPFLYTLEFEDAARTLTLAANTSVNVSSSWISLSVSITDPFISASDSRKESA